jgi:hypothetical protein
VGQEVNWLEIAAVVVLLVGLGAGGFLVVQRPSFWLGIFSAALTGLLPHITKRMTPEQEKALQECHRRGGNWDHFRKKCRYK